MPTRVAISRTQAQSRLERKKHHSHQRPLQLSAIKAIKAIIHTSAPFNQGNQGNHSHQRPRLEQRRDGQQDAAHGPGGDAAHEAVEAVAAQPVERAQQEPAQRGTEHAQRVLAT